MKRLDEIPEEIPEDILESIRRKSSELSLECSRKCATALHFASSLLCHSLVLRALGRSSLEAVEEEAGRATFSVTPASSGKLPVRFLGVGDARSRDSSH